MAPFILAAIPSLIQAAPSLIRIFGNGEQSEKNAKAAEHVAQIAREITNTDTTEAAVHAIQSDPVMQQTFAGAVEEKWYQITGEAGGGGIDGARKFDISSQNSKPWMSPALWVAGALIPLVYIVVSAVMFGSEWTMEVKAMVVSSIISLVLGSITGFFLGTSYGSQKKTQMLVGRSQQ